MEQHQSMESTLAAHWDAVIIGGGHNGLVAANYLAKAGKSVLVLEREDTLGGATQSKRIFPDYDAWLSRYAYLVSLFPQQIIQELGLGFQVRRRAIASFTPWSDGSGIAGGLLLSNVDSARSQQSMRDLTGDDDAWKGYQHLLQLEQAIASIAWPSLLEPLRDRQHFVRQLSNELQREAWQWIVERPIGELLERLFDHDLLRGLFLTDAKIGVFTHPHEPSGIQNRCFVYHVIGGGTGEWQVPVGGMRSLVHALVEKGKSLGVTFLTSAMAEAIQLSDPEHEVFFRWQGSEYCVAAEHVLINAGPRAFASLLGEVWQPATNDEGSVIKMNMLLRRLPKLKCTSVAPADAFCGSLHLDEGYQQMQLSYQTALRGELPSPAPCEIYCHTLTDNSILSPQLQQSGFHTLTLFGLDMPYRLFERQNDLQRAAVQELYLQGLDRICQDSFRDCLAIDSQGNPCIEIMTPVDLERSVHLDLGNIFHNSLSWFFAESENQVGSWGVETAYPRIYRAGSAALRGGAVSGIPGRNAALCALNFDASRSI